MANLSSNGANYQHSGLEPLRSFPTDEYSPIISDKGPATDRIAAAYQEDGTANLRASGTQYTSKIVSGGSAKSQTPPAVDSFADHTV